MLVRIGFENTTYTVDEGIGSLEVCVRVSVPDDTVVLPLFGGLTITAVVTTVAGTAGMHVYSYPLIDSHSICKSIFFYYRRD